MPGPRAVRVGVRSDDALYAEALCDAIDRMPRFSSVPGRQRFAEADVLLLDVGLSDLPKVLGAAHGAVPAIVWGGYLHPTQVRELEEAGAFGYLSVISLHEQLQTALEVVVAGRRYFPDLGPAGRIRLTPAEDRVMRAYLIDLATHRRAEVAMALGLSDRTVKVHIANVRSRLPEPAGSRVLLLRALRARGWS